MNSREFEKWEQHHQAVFPDVGRWFGEMLAVNFNRCQEVRTAWFSALSGLSLATAIEASDLLLTGKVKAPTHRNSYQDFPRLILEASTFVKARQVQGAKPRERWRVDCATCADSGQVLVWSESSVAAARSGSEIVPASVVVACRCSAGKHESLDECEDFDARRMLVYPIRPDSPVALRALREFAAGLPAEV